jgi:hypothetical protein
VEAASAAREDIYTRVTNQMVERLEAGVLPWFQPWQVKKDRTAKGTFSDVRTGADQRRSIASRACSCLSGGRVSFESLGIVSQVVNLHAERRSTPRAPLWRVSERIDIDFRELVGRRRHDVTAVMGVDRPRPLGRRTATGDTGSGSTGSPTCARILLIGPGSMMKVMRRMSPPHARHTSGNLSAIRASSLAHAIREVPLALRSSGADNCPLVPPAPQATPASNI